MAGKLEADLSERLKGTDGADLVEVVVRLGSSAAEAAEPESRSRQEMIAAKKEAFSRSMAPVEDAVRRAGGEITGHAWINRTIRARVPAGRVEELAEQETVEALSVPRLLEPETD